MIERRRGLAILGHAVLILGVAAMCFPLWMALVASTHEGPRLSQRPFPLWFGDVGLETYARLLTEGPSTGGSASAGRMLFNSLIMALGVAFGKIAVSLTAAFAIVYFRFWGRMLFFWLIFITLMLPIEVRIFPTFDVVNSLSLINTHGGMILPLVASATATFLFRQVFLTTPPELVEAAKIDGAGPLKFFWDILLPMSRTNIAALFIILFIYGWNQYLWPLLVSLDEDYYTVVMGIQRMVNSGEALPVWNEIMAVALLGMLPPVLVVLFMQKLFVKGLVEQEK